MTAVLEQRRAAPESAGQQQVAPQRRTPRPRRFAPWLWGVVGIAVLVAIWELYRLVGPVDGFVLGELRLLPRASDLAMPHVAEMIARLFSGETRSSTSEPLWLAVAQASLVTGGTSAVGFVVGVIVGLGFALLMLAFRVGRWALLPWIVLSQTVPLIAFAPMVRSWGSQLTIGAFEWQDWMSVALIASYLAFFPVAVGALAGFESPDRVHVELMRTYAAGWWRVFVRLRLPAAVPHLLTALRLAAANAIIGAVVAEVSTGSRGGIGRMIIQFAGQASSDPPKAWAPIFGAVALGLLAAGSLAATGWLLKDYRRVEVSSA
ncbi:ABC transporter permease [Microbacterium halotolerans]|uniref:ABC transporter permease n=1 Tax=Microbacterium halotolerans TaxID=246613 RepID=UPI000E6AB5A5|nr:ABC transporter permease subunit [Microbacterium halotolerans]